MSELRRAREDAIRAIEAAHEDGRISYDELDAAIQRLENAETVMDVEDVRDRVLG